MAAGVAAMQGWRTEMEDAHCLQLDLGGPVDDSSLFAVFDGHGGKEVALYCAKRFPEVLRENLARSLGAAPEREGPEGSRGPALHAGLSDTFFEMDRLMCTEEGMEQIRRLSGGGDSGSEADGSPQGSAGEASAGDSRREAAVNAVKSQIQQALKDLHQQQQGTAGLGAVGGDLAEAILMDDDSGGVEIVFDDGDATPGATTAGGVAGAGSRGGRPGSGADAGPSAGCTAVVALIADGQLIVANAGDSRCVLCRSGEASALSRDHKPTDPDEHARIAAAGGFVTEGRVNGSLNLSRALGDMEYKQRRDLPAEAQAVTALPEILATEIHDCDEFIILACDGIWDVMTNQQAVDFVRDRLRKGVSLAQICEQACDHCLAPSTEGSGVGCDNMSIVVVQLKPPLIKRQGSGKVLRPRKV